MNDEASPPARTLCRRLELVWFNDFEATESISGSRELLTDILSIFFAELDGLINIFYEIV